MDEASSLVASCGLDRYVYFTDIRVGSDEMKSCVDTTSRAVVSLTIFHQRYILLKGWDTTCTRNSGFASVFIGFTCMIVCLFFKQFIQGCHHLYNNRESPQGI